MPPVRIVDRNGQPWRLYRTPDALPARSGELATFALLDGGTRCILSARFGWHRDTRAAARRLVGAALALASEPAALRWGVS